MKKTLTCIISIALCLMFLCSCESFVGYTFKGFLGDKICVEVPSKGYSLKHGHGRFRVLKGDQEILQGYITNADEWERCYEAAKAGTIDVIENTDERIIWRDGHDIHSLIMVTPFSYVYAYGTASADLAEDDIKATLDVMQCREDINASDDSVIEL